MLTTLGEHNSLQDVLELRQSEQWSPIHGGVKVVVDAACHQLAPGDVVELSATWLH